MKRTVFGLLSVLVLLLAMGCEADTAVLAARSAQDERSANSALRAQPTSGDATRDCNAAASRSRVQRKPVRPLQTGTDDGRRYF